MNQQRWRSFFLFVLLLFAPAPSFADQVTPSDRVTHSVAIRTGPSTDAPAIGKLLPGEKLPLEGEAPNWYRVRLPNGQSAYVSKAWTYELAEPPVGPVPPAAAAPVYRIHVVDVGTGLGVFVEGPDFSLVYDAGSNDDKALGPNDRFMAYLRFTHPQLTRIDHVILSHAHQDHVLMIPDVFAAYAVTNVWDSGRMYDSCTYRYFLEAVAAEPAVTYHEVANDPGDRSVAYQAGCHRPSETLVLHRGAPIDANPIPLGAGASMTILYRDATPYADPNSNSLVTRLDLGPVRILLTGDAEGGERRDPSSPPDANSAEARLLACCRADLKADIQFAGHHGSKTSSRQAFVDAVGAKVFVISSGPMQYGGTHLPDDEVVQELQARGQLWRTDLDDAACAANPEKIGPDADGRAGGCDNIVITVQSTSITVSDVRLAD